MKTLDLHIIDIVHNSIRAGAGRIGINIVDNEAENLFSIKITDNGCGMDKEMIDAINSTFYSSRKERKIGMGIALLKYHSELANGKFTLKSEKGVGTEVLAIFERNNIDMQPLGDFAGCFATFICQFQETEFVITYELDSELFEISTSDVKEVFEGMNLNNPTVILNLKELIQSNITREN